MIGKILLCYRNKRGLSRKELSQGICSEKYIYLIETNQRNPSIFVMDKLSQKLGVNLAEFTSYLDYKDPVKCKHYSEVFFELRINSQFDKLLALTEEAKALEDFQKAPLKYEIIINHSLFDVLFRSRNTDVSTLITHLFKTDSNEISQVQKGILFLIRSIAYQNLKRYSEASQDLIKSKDLLRPVDYDCHYCDYYISTSLNEASLELHLGHFQKVIDLCDQLITFMIESRTLDRLHFVHAYLTISYFMLEKLDPAKEYFDKIIQRLNFEYRLYDYHLLLTVKGFKAVYDYFNGHHMISSSYLKDNLKT